MKTKYQINKAQIMNIKCRSCTMHICIWLAIRAWSLTCFHKSCRCVWSRQMSKETWTVIHHAIYLYKIIIYMCLVKIVQMLSVYHLLMGFIQNYLILRGKQVWSYGVIINKLDAHLLLRIIDVRTFLFVALWQYVSLI